MISRLVILLPVLLLAGNALAQSRGSATLSGRVTGEPGNEPLAGAHVFLGRTMLGTVTDADGGYTLAGVPFGSHTVWVSILGFETTSKDIVVGDTTARVVDIALPQAVLEMGEVTVEARQDRRWRKRLETFQHLFIGETQFARETVLLNPEVLDFDANWLGAFEARAAAPLALENRALGYRVQYLLKEFEREGGTIRYDGDPLYEMLTPANPDEAAYWEDNRRVAFEGSLRHFLLTLWDRTTVEAGFEVYRIPSVDDIHRNDRRFPIDPNDLLVPAGTPDLRILTFPGLLEITYTREREEPLFLAWQSGTPHRPLRDQRSWIRLTDGPTEIDTNGEIVDPYGVTVYGYFAFERMANEVPKEYRPD